MKYKEIFTSIFVSCFAVPAVAGTFEWTSGWGMGVSEYHVSDGNSNEMIISCPNDPEDGYVSASVTINGETYSSESKGRNFDVIVDGEHYSNPFYTDCRVCGDVFRTFWGPLRNANNLIISADGKTVRFPTKNIKEMLHPLDSEKNSCFSSW